MTDAIKETMLDRRRVTVCQYTIERLADSLPRDGDVITAIRVYPSNVHCELWCEQPILPRLTLYAGPGKALWKVYIPVIDVQYATLKLWVSKASPVDIVAVEWLFLPNTERKQMAQGSTSFTIGQGSKFATYRGLITFDEDSKNELDTQIVCADDV